MYLSCQACVFLWTSLQLKASTPEKYMQCKVYSTVKLMLETLPKAEWPHAAIIGLPPKKHGGTRTDADLELVAAFPTRISCPILHQGSEDEGLLRSAEEGGRTGDCLQTCGTKRTGARCMPMRCIPTARRHTTKRSQVRQSGSTNRRAPLPLGFKAADLQRNGKGSGVYVCAFGPGSIAHSWALPFCVHNKFDWAC